MKISFSEGKRSTEVHPIYCPDCGERAKNVVLLPGCDVTGLSIRCKRCGKIKSVEAHDKKN